MMKKTIAIYFSEADPYGYPFNNEFVGKHYLEIYEMVISEISERTGGEVACVMVRGDSYLGKGEFSHGFKFTGKGQIERIEGPIKVDLIFNRDNLNTIPTISDCDVINKMEFDRMCVDKQETAKVFSDMSPRTVLLKNFIEFKNLVSDFLAGDELVVLKQNGESGGNGIFVLPIIEVTEDLYPDWSQVLMQEFLESKDGIPNVVDGRHDLRVTVVNGKICNSFLRIPAKNGYLANLSQGGSSRELDLSLVPHEIIEMVKKVITYADKNYDSYLFSADFINSHKGFKLIELNSRPGLLHPDFVSNWKVFNDAVIEMLIDAVNSK